MGLSFFKKKGDGEEEKKGSKADGDSSAETEEQTDAAETEDDGDEKTQLIGKKKDKKKKGKDKDKKEKGKKDKAKKVSKEEEEAASFKRDPVRANKFFQHAQAVADTGNYDYAIECFISGLRYDPDNMDKHEALFEVAKRRKVSGGKPAGLGEKMKSGKTTLEKMLHSEQIWCKDPLNASLMLATMKKSSDAAEIHSDLSLGELTYWVGAMVMETAQRDVKTGVQTFIDIRDTFAKVGAWDKAVEACRSALSLEPDDAQLLLDLKNLEAELTMMQGQYEAKQDQGGYRTFVKDLDKQQELADEDAVAKTPQQIVRLIERARKEFQENPDDHDVIQKYVRALVSKEAKKEDEEAVELLRKLWEESGQYKFKQQIGDIRIKQMNRALRQAKKKIEKDPKNVALKKKFKEFNDKKAKFEMKEYRDRAKNYPTDMSIKFELGKRLIYFKQTDEAIAALQEAQADPKLRATSLQFLGQCYVEKGWLEESIATFKRAQEIHPTPDDKLGMSLRYLLMDAYERRAKEEGSSDHSKLAKQVASQILQTNINYRDIKKRIEGIRKLDAEIQQKEKEAKPEE